MIFTSYVFVALLAVTVALYWVLPWERPRLAVLFLASIVFYSWHHWPSVFLLLFTITTNYVAGRALEKNRSKPILIAIVALNLSILLWFKYAAFVVENLVALLEELGLTLEQPEMPRFLPLGISFFTFQVVGYQVDIYRREIDAEHDPLRFAVFKCFFAQLIAGPIVRASEFLPQLRTLRRFDATQFHRGIFLLIAGFTLKLAVADVLAQFVHDAFAAPQQLSTIRAWTGLYAFAFQLFADFWGYSTIAVGLGFLFGYELPINFRTPYLSTSLREFWRRWHMTLSSWFRDYVYVPLGGNRSHAMRNLIITMAIAGLWHGAGWTFVLWGLVNGVWLAAERLFPRKDQREDPLPLRAIKTLLVFHGVCLCWVLFRAPDLHIASAYYQRLLLPPYTWTSVPSILVQWLIGFALVHPLIQWMIEEGRFAKLAIKQQVAVTVTMVVLILAFAASRIDFIYFTF